MKPLGAGWTYTSVPTPSKRTIYKLVYDKRFSEEVIKDANMLTRIGIPKVALSVAVDLAIATRRVHTDEGSVVARALQAAELVRRHRYGYVNSEVVGGCYVLRLNHRVLGAVQKPILLIEVYVVRLHTLILTCASFCSFFGSTRAEVTASERANVARASLIVDERLLW